MNLPSSLVLSGRGLGPYRRGSGSTERCRGPGREEEEEHSLSGDLDELLEELHPLVERGAQTHLGDHPKLGLVEPPQEQVQVGRGLLEALLPERVVNQLMLAERGNNGT